MPWIPLQEKDVASQIIDQSDACVGCGRQSKQPSFLTSARQQHQGYTSFLPFEALIADGQLQLMGPMCRLQPIVNIIADPPSESDFNEAVGFLQSRRHTGSDAPRGERLLVSFERNCIWLKSSGPVLCLVLLRVLRCGAPQGAWVGVVARQ